MTASEGSFLGFAKQAGGLGVAETTDANFKYLLYREGTIGPRNIVIPLPEEVGGGAMSRSMVKVGVNLTGVVDLVPRPETLGFFLHGITGSVSTVTNYNITAVKSSHALDGSTVNTLLGQPSVATKITIKGSAGSTGTVTVAGNVSGLPDTEVITCSGTAYVTGSKLFETITSLDYSNDAGKTVEVGWKDGSYTHTFVLGADQFDAPYYTLRYAPGNMWGEQFVDGRVNLFSMDFKAANFLSGIASFLGKTPSKVSTASWSALSYVDGGPQFISPVSSIELPTGATAKVLQGSFVSNTNIPLDEQYIVGSYYPERLDVVHRAYMLQLVCKIDDDTLYKKMMYDPAGGNAWVASIYKEADIKLQFRSDQDAAAVVRTDATGAVRPYEVNIAANGQTAASGDANVFWSAEPVATRAQRQVLMQVTGQFMADPLAGDPITFTLVNRRASY